MASLTHVVLRLCISMGKLAPSLVVVNVFGKSPGHAASHPFINQKGNENQNIKSNSIPIFHFGFRFQNKKTKTTLVSVAVCSLFNFRWY